MSSFDLGDVVPLGITTYNDASGDPEDASAVALAITKPDGTAVSPAPTLTHVNGSGVWTYNYPPPAVGRYIYEWTVTGTTTVLGGVEVDTFDVIDRTDPTPVVSVTDAREELNLTTGTDDEIADYIARATAILENKTGRVFTRRTVTDQFDISAADTTVFLKPPTVSVTSVVVDGVTLATTAYRFNPRNGILELDGWRFGTSGVGLVVVTYVAGYSAPPDDLKHAVLRQLAHMWENQRTTPGARRDPDAYTPGYLVPNAVLEAISAYMVPGAAS